MKCDVANFIGRANQCAACNLLCASQLAKPHQTVQTGAACIRPNVYNFLHIPILPRFYSSATRPPSPPIATVAPRYLLDLTFPDFDLAPKRDEKFGYSLIADLIWYSAVE